MAINKDVKPIDNEILVDPNKVIISKTDRKGIIEYANDYFVEISGYSKEELKGKAHNIIRHPDMPKIIFKIMWDKLHAGDNLYAIVKNMTKDGSFYWVVTKFETSYDKNGTIIAHYARRKAVPIEVRETTESIYEVILKIEKHDVDQAEKALYEILEKYGLTYDTLFLELAGMTEEEIYDYFQSKEQNVNTVSENMIFEIDTTEVEHDVASKVESALLNKNIESTEPVESTESIETIELIELIEPTESVETIELIESAEPIKPIKKKKSKSGFFGDSKELKDALSLLKRKKLE